MSFAPSGTDAHIQSDCAQPLEISRSEIEILPTAKKLWDWRVATRLSVAAF
jgi:hypothetical protein